MVGITSFKDNEPNRQTPQRKEGVQEQKVRNRGVNSNHNNNNNNNGNTIFFSDNVFVLFYRYVIHRRDRETGLYARAHLLTFPVLAPLTNKSKNDLSKRGNGLYI